MNGFNIFRSNVHWKVIYFLTLHGNDHFLNLSGLSKKIGISKSMASNALNDLLSMEIVKNMKISNSHIYSLGEGALIDQIKKTIGLDMIIRSGLIGSLLEMDPDLISIYLYGSFARGDFDRRSDIDILLISSSGRVKNIGSLDPIEGFDVNIETFTPGSWSSIKKENKIFSSRVMEDHVTLYGSGLI